MTALVSSTGLTAVAPRATISPVTTMKGWVGYILLGLSLFIAYQGYHTAQKAEGTQEMARSAACDVDSGCVLKDDLPREIRTDVFQRRYEWRSSVGPVHVVCRRAYVFLGPWSCEAKKGAIGAL